MSDNPIVGAKDEVETKVKGFGPYVRAHWKELLALVLAAIPALFIVFHQGTRQAAQQAMQPILDAIPGGPGSPGNPSGGGGDPGTNIDIPAAAPASATPSSTLGISVNGSQPRVGNIAPKTQVQSPVASSSSSSIVSRLGAAAPGFRDTSQQVATSPASKVSLLNPVTAAVQAITAKLPNPVRAPGVIAAIKQAQAQPPPPPVPVSSFRPQRTGAQQG